MGTQDSKTEAAERPAHQFKPGTSGNPGGQPKWVKATRDALRECAPYAARHLARMLGAPATGPESPADAALYAKAGAKDRNAAAELVLRYTLSLPKASLKVQGGGGNVVVEVRTLAQEEKVNG